MTKLEEIRIVKEKLKQEIKSLPWYRGIGITNYAEDFALVVNVAENSVPILPKEIDGFVVVTKVVGDVTPLVNND